MRDSLTVAKERTRSGVADAPDTGEEWSDTQIAAALTINADTVARILQRLVASTNSARRRVFDGEARSGPCLMPLHSA